MLIQVHEARCVVQPTNAKSRMRSSTLHSEGEAPNAGASTSAVAWMQVAEDADGEVLAVGARIEDPSPRPASSMMAEISSLLRSKRCVRDGCGPVTCRLLSQLLGHPSAARAATPPTTTTMRYPFELSCHTRSATPSSRPSARTRPRDERPLTRPRRSAHAVAAAGFAGVVLDYVDNATLRSALPSVGTSANLLIFSSADQQKNRGFAGL